VCSVGSSLWSSSAAMTTAHCIVWLADDNHLVQMIKNTQNKNCDDGEVGFLVGCQIQQDVVGPQKIYLTLSAISDLKACNELPAGLRVFGVYAPSIDSCLRVRKGARKDSGNECDLDLLCEYTTRSENSLPQLHFRDCKYKLDIPHHIYSRNDFDELLRKVLCLVRVTFPLSLSFASRTHDYAQSAARAVQQFIDNEWRPHVDQWQWIATHRGCRHLLFRNNTRTLRDVLTSPFSATVQKIAHTSPPYGVECVDMQMRRVLSLSHSSDNIFSPRITYTPLAVTSQMSSTRWYSHHLLLDVVLYHEHHHTFIQVIDSISRALTAHMQCVVKWLVRYPEQQVALRTLHFRVPSVSHVISILYPSHLNGEPISDDELRSTRAEYHTYYWLPHTRPWFRPHAAINLCNVTEDVDENGKSSPKLSDVHIAVAHGGVPGGMRYLVQGSYEYYHYLHDGVNDEGWGCAYRSMQTLCSWFRRQHYTTRPVPSHVEIQRMLVELGDKPLSFLHSKEWIGAVEIALCLQHYWSVDCKILNLPSGADFAKPEICRQICRHFEQEGTPVMIGGGVLAYTLLGISFHEARGEVQYLILDPHYTGSDNLKSIIDKGWCAWHSPSLFRKDKFYNLCMPLRPKFI